MHPITKTALTLTASLAFLAAPAIATAADAAPPTYATASVSGDDTVKGTVTAFDGRFALTVRDDRGFVDHVRLHDGTIINPTGLTLAPGEHVTVLGANAGSVLSANEIDTPYAPPTPAYDVYGPGIGYPYFGAGYPYYGPAIGFGYRFGGYHRFR